ncbi:conserved hypothetical protein [Leishmania major strain Friedlin]|uniref:Uncharacterized protein n=1 Tax=Leishmania major TaxID=5664 RepID=Q4Q375_LEIMA|nr:conserved hypothetical protein [Leishmania major strain Friedlin]CAG9581976.1 Protein_of_unknown_function_(DUF3595)_-_putative [Leishmania major strain Friedlin]CAJ07837.1 conserved hypothetical protein [Leishmania major strain Friedlin]|eukprot:XP_001686223.1 conserved hypothetical protein [Leishmania major strain Friedlin]
MPELPYAVVNGAYLFLVLQLLFLLAVVWQSVVAASLLFSFVSLSCLESVRWGALDSGKQQNQSLHAEVVVVRPSTAEVSRKQNDGGTEVSVSALHATHKPPAPDGCRASCYRCTPPPPREERSSVTIASCMKCDGDLASPDMGPPSTSREREPCRDAGNVSAGLYSPIPNGADNTLIYFSSASNGPNTERLIAENVCTQGDQDDAQAEMQHRRRGAPVSKSQMHVQSFYLAPRSGWVFATAVISLATVCASVVLFGLLYSSMQVDASPAGAVLPGWATTPVAKSLLTVCVGIQVHSSNPKLCFCGATACLSVVSLTSWCLLLSRALGGCVQGAHKAASLVVAGSRVTATSRWSRVRVGWNTALRLFTGAVTSAPYSLGWVGAAGVGQGTALGLLSLAVVMVVLLLSSSVGRLQRQRVGHPRQRLWVLYTCMLLCLWEVQMVVLLPPVQHSLKVASVWARHGRWLAAVGAVPAASPDSMLRWRIVQAIGLWWAGTEFVCYHAAAPATSQVASLKGGQKLRALLLRELAQRDENQWSRAVNQQRAAHGKLQQLRLERDIYLYRPSRAGSNDWWRHAQRGRSDRSAHAPFGSNVSHCCWLCRDDPQHLPTSVGGGRRDGHECNPTLFHNGPAPSSAAGVHAHDTCWTAAAVGSSSLYSNASVYDCLAGIRAPWQHSENASAQPSPASAEGDSAAVLVTATAAVVLSESAAEPLKLHNLEVERPLYMWQGWARAPTRSPCKDGGDGDEDDTGVRHSSCGSYSNGEHRAYRWSPPPSHSSAHSPYTFSVTTSIPLPGHSRLHGAGCSSARWPSMIHGTSVDISAVGHASSFAEEAAHQRPPLSPEASAHPEEVRAEHAPVSLSMVSAEETRRAADARPPLSSLLARLRGRAESVAHKAVELLRGYLWRHTILLPAEVENSATECPAGPRADVVHPQRQPRRQPVEKVAEHTQPAFASATSLTAAEGITPPPGIRVGAPSSTVSRREVVHLPSLWRLLELYAVQYWSSLCALLMLSQFAVCGTVVNLAPSFVSIVYALLQRPWPPLWYWRVQLLFTALAFLAKGAARVYLLTMGPSVSLTTCRWLSLLLLRVGVGAPSAPVASLSSPSSSTMFGSESHRDMWVDLALSGCVVTAVAIQWAVVYPDHCVFWNCKGERDATANVSAAAFASLEPIGPPTREARQGKPHRGVAELWRSCKRHLQCWSAHRCGAGADYYAAQLFFDSLSLALFGWAYYAIVPEDIATSEGNFLHAVQQNHLPGIFVATALGLVVVLFLERILYVLHALFAKYLLHFFLAAVYHVLYVLWRAAQESKGGSGATPSAATTASVSLLLSAKFASLWCGALQLRHGYALHHLHDPFTIKTDLLHWLGHVSFRAVPFLMELRVMLDWSFSATTLKVQHWMLLEDIHHTVYRRYVDMHDLYHTSRHHGRHFPYLVRLYQGVLGFTVILFVLFFPLFWYSTFSPQVRASHVTAWATEVALARMSSVPLFSADAAVRPFSFHAAATISLGGASVGAAGLLRFAAVTGTWQTAHVASCSTRMWSYTPAALQELVDRLGKRTEVVTLLVRHRVTRNRASEAAMITVGLEESYALPPTSQALLAEALNAWRTMDDADSAGTAEYSASAWDPIEVPLPLLYSPYVLSYGTGVSFLSGATMRRANCSLTLHRTGRYRGFSCVKCAEGGQSSPATATFAAATTANPAGSSQIASGAEIREMSSPLTFVVASNNVAIVQSSFSLIPNVGIIALYTSFVLVMSSYIRNYFAGDAHRVVLLQLANPEPVTELLRYLYLARSSANDGQVGDLALEQLLFVELLDLLRSPERLLRLSGRRVDDYAYSTYRQVLYDATRRPFAPPGEGRG